jgi:integrase
MLVELLLGTGIRIGSALALEIGDIDFEHGEAALRTTKNDRPATAVMPVTVAKSLRVFIGDRTSGPVFLARDRRISMRHAQRRLAGWLAEAGIVGKSAHSLRHTFATGLLAKTGNLRLVQAAMGHASIVSTTIYSEVDRAGLREAVGA